MYRVFRSLNNLPRSCTYVRVMPLTALFLCGGQGCPDLIHLMEEGEDKEEFFKLPVEEVLLRWFNHHLR